VKRLIPSVSVKRLFQSISVLGLCGAVVSASPAVQAARPAGPEGGGKRVLDSGQYIAPSGEVFGYEKAVVDGKDVRVYLKDGQILSEEALRAREAAQAPVLDEDLLRQARATAPEQPLEVVVWMRNRPGGRINRELRQAREGELRKLEERAREIQRSLRPDKSLTPEEEARFIEEAKRSGGLLSERQKADLEEIGGRIESIKKELREESARRVKEATADDRGKLERRLAALGGRVRGHIATQNAFEVTVPAGRLVELAQDPLVARIIAVPPAEKELDNQGSSLGLTSGFWSANVTGGIWDVGVLDTGVQQDHPALSHLGFLSNFGTTDGDGHGTGVAGIIASNDTTFRGMAFGVQTMLVGNASSGSVLSHADWMVSTATDDAEVINLSFGYGTASDSDYSTFDQFWDGLIDDNSVLVTKSAGNNGNGTTTITHPAPAYNLIAVANVNDLNTVSRTDDVITSSSSRGPTLNGRKKPDISAPGNNSMTTNNDWAGTGPDFVNLGGTSAAAPHVNGGAILLTDLRSNDNPAANKAILLNTADAWTDNNTPGDTSDDGVVSGSLWNKTYGWGYMDLWEAWYNGLDVFTGSVDDGVTPAGPDFKLYKGQMFANEKASLVWNRHVAYSGATEPTLVEDLSDLDLFAYDATTGTVLDSSVSSIDNVEQVAVAANGEVVLKVDVFGSLDPNLSTESFALATEENFVAATAPSFAFTGAPATARCGASFVLSAAVKNNGTVASFNNTVTLALPTGMTLVSGAASQNVGTIAAGGSATASWTVSSSFCVFPISRTVTFSNSSISYGESFSGTASHTLSFNP
jgi:serine protease AprX